MEIFKISRNRFLGELNIRKQCVPGSFFSTHVQESGNEASRVTDDRQRGHILIMFHILVLCHEEEQKVSFQHRNHSRYKH